MDLLKSVSALVIQLIALAATVLTYVVLADLVHVLVWHGTPMLTALDDHLAVAYLAAVAALHLLSTRLTGVSSALIGLTSAGSAS